MIKLTINPGHNEQERFFDKKSIRIGNFSEDADLYLPEEAFSSSHLEIAEQNGTFIANNKANDPFTSHNGAPFGYQQIKDKDLIKIGDTVILFEAHDDAEHLATHQVGTYSRKLIAAEVKMAPLLEKSFKEESHEKETRIEDLLRRVEQLDEPAEEDLGKSEITEPLTTKFSFENIIIEEDEEEEENSPEGITRPGIPLAASFATNKGFNTMIAMIIVVVFIGVFGMGITYYRFSGKMIEEEKKAGGAIADITMALTYAKIYHIKPRKQNWSSREFLANNLQPVLSSHYESMLELNTLRQIADTSYFLRIYTNSDQSRFLIIAQPAHSFSQWWIPKSAIIVDTDGMVMRKIDDLRALNRLLTTPQPLDGKNGENVFALIREGEPIPLASLATRKHKRGFAPPKALAMIRPGAENLIYNAPRYSPLGEALIQKALSLIEKPGTETDVSMLLDDYEALKKFPDMVYYTSQGMQRAILAQRALKTFIPKKKFLIAYLKYNSKGQEVSSNLLMSDEQAAPVPKATSAEIPSANLKSTKKGDLGQIIGKLPMPKPTSSKAAVTAEKLEERQASNVAEREEVPSNQSGKLIEILENSHPLYLRLIRLQSRREQALYPLSTKMHKLIQRHDKVVLSDFHQAFQEVLQEYNEVDQAQRKEILADIKSLYQDYSDVPLDKVMHFINQAGLGALVEESLHKTKTRLGHDILQKSDVEQQIKKISESQYLEELEHHATETAKMLTVERLPVPKKLIAYQGQVRATVERKLEEFLLKPDTKLPPETFHPETEGILMNILHQAWVFDPDEYDFYLNEFDFLRELYVEQSD